MQIKERGTKIVFIRFEYNTEKKRTVNQSIGTQDKNLTTLSESVAARMSDAEKVEAKEWFAARKERYMVEMAKYHIKSVPAKMRDAITALNNDHAMEQLSKEDFDAIYKTWADLANAMRNAGFKRPRS